MKLVLFSLVFVLGHFTQTPTPSFVGSWKGYYTLYETQHPIEFTVSEDRRISGTYDDGDWKKGKIHGEVEKSGKFKFLLKHGNNPSFGQVLGKFTLSEDGKTLKDDNAIYQHNEISPDKKNPMPSQVKLNRQP